MAHVISVLSKKGGTGKTTISISIAAALALRGHKVILIDSDAGNDSSTHWAAVNGGKYFPVTHTTDEALGTLIKSLNDGFDYIIIDGAPEANKDISNAIKCSSLVLIVTQTSLLDVRRNEAIALMVTEIHEFFDLDVPCYWLLSQCQKGTNIINKTLDKLQDSSVPQVFGSATSALVAYKEAFESCETVFDADKSISNIEQARTQINNITDEVLEVINAK